MTRNPGGGARRSSRPAEARTGSEGKRGGQPRVAILVFPFASQSTIHLAGKIIAAAGAIAPDLLVAGRPEFEPAVAQCEGATFIPLAVRMHYASDINPALFSKFLWIVKCIISELEMGWIVLTRRRRIDSVFCTVGCYYHIPGIVAKALGKELIVGSFGLEAETARSNYGKWTVRFLEILIRLLYRLSDKIVVESRRLTGDPVFSADIRKCRDGALFVESEFRRTTPLEERRNLVGFIGRISLEKGILPFAQAIPEVLSTLPGTEFIIIGSGRADDLLQSELDARRLTDKVVWLRWMEHTEVVRWLNQIKLLVVPSATEGLPYIVLEAAACGTPVLASAVGGIPDIMVDRESGFLLPDGSSGAIVRGILAALSYERLDRIAERAAAMVEAAYSFPACVARYRSILLDAA
jgi:glycosyltransferase involved in cell wall biosynthesis